MSDQEENGEEIEAEQAYQIPAQEWDWLEVPAIACRVLAGTARCFGQGLDAIATELQTAAQWHRATRAEDRERWEQDVARAEMAGYLEGQILFDEPVALDPRDLS